MIRILNILALTFCGLTLSLELMAVELNGRVQQGAILFGQAEPGSVVQYDGQTIMLSAEGRFVIGFGRDETGQRSLQVTQPDGTVTEKTLRITPQEYKIERIDGLPPSKVTPDPSVLKRIRAENAMVGAARKRRDSRTDYTQGFIWPAKGRLSGFYGSQRILNGEPRRPHFGVDIAAPTGTPVVAPAAGIITLTHDDMYYSGGTIILDHGQGLTSTFLHLSKILVETGTRVECGDLIGEIGATGRATGPHLDWRMNWLQHRVNPHSLMDSIPESLE